MVQGQLIVLIIWFRLRLFRCTALWHIRSATVEWGTSQVCVNDSSTKIRPSDFPLRVRIFAGAGGTPTEGEQSITNCSYARP